MATALIKITQGITTDLAGRALKGVTGTSVVFSNGDDTDVLTWTYELLEVPPGSTVSLTSQGPNTTPNFTITPDVAGSYRVRLAVAGSSNVDTDIRVFVVPFPTRGILAPPYQGLPAPLPLTGSGSKPDEFNVGGQARGWMGDLNSSRPMLHKVLELVDSFTSGSTVAPLTSIYYVDGGTAVSTPDQTGSFVAPFATIGQALAVASAGTIILVAPNTYSEDINITVPNVTLASVTFSRSDLLITPVTLGGKVIYNAGASLLIVNFNILDEITMADNGWLSLMNTNVTHSVSPITGPVANQVLEMFMSNISTDVTVSDLQMDEQSTIFGTTTCAFASIIGGSSVSTLALAGTGQFLSLLNATISSFTGSFSTNPSDLEMDERTRQKTFCPGTNGAVIATLSSDVNNWFPGSTNFQFYGAEILLIESAGGVPRNITGLYGVRFLGSPVTMKIVNETGQPLTWKHQSTSSSAANRIICSNGTDIIQRDGEVLDAYYQYDIQRWLLKQVTNGVVRGNTTLSFGIINAGQTKTVTASISGATISMPVAVSPEGDLPISIVFQCARIPSSNTLAVQLQNVSVVSNITVGDVTFDYLVGTP